MRAVCIHGHFYQPPRENPWVGVVGRQRSARPFHDWNERITAECYAPNADARVVDGAVSRRVANYRELSFDVGPTLHEWLAEHAPVVDRAIVDAGRQRGAIAQAYNHAILPLADGLTKALQVRWGIRDFEHRFGRAPEGLWLPETAVDTPTLEVLVRSGIRFAIVAPHQIARVRAPGSDRWTPTSESALDTRRAYVARTPAGRSRCSRTTARSHARSRSRARSTTDERSVRGWPTRRSRLPSPRWCTSRPMARATATTTRTGRWRSPRRSSSSSAAVFPRRPTASSSRPIRRRGSARSRSAPRGAVRTASNAGARHAAARSSPGPARRGARRSGRPRTTSGAPSATRFPRTLEPALLDWIDVHLRREPAAALLARHGVEDAPRARLAIETAWNAQRAFTSCGWFFDDVGGLEGVQILRYLARGAELLERWSPRPVALELRTILADAHANDGTSGTALFDRVLARDRATPLDLAALWARHAVAPGDEGPPSTASLERLLLEAVDGSHRGEVTVRMRDSGEAHTHGVRIERGGDAWAGPRGAAPGAAGWRRVHVVQDDE